jgi:hypothetical protein
MRKGLRVVVGEVDEVDSVVAVVEADSEEDPRTLVENVNPRIRKFITCCVSKRKH